MNTFLAVVSAIGGLFCLFAVFYDGFEDTFGQRVGLAVMSISLYPITVQFYDGLDIAMGAKVSLACGLAIFLIATALKGHPVQPEQHAGSPHSHVPH